MTSAPDQKHFELGQLAAFKPLYLNLRSKDSFPEGERPYFSPEAERLLLTAGESSNVVGLTTGKIPVIPAPGVLDPRLVTEIEELVAEGLLLVIPRIYSQKNTGELEVMLLALGCKSSKKGGLENVREVFFQIVRKSANAIRNFEITSNNEKGIELNEVLYSLSEGVNPHLKIEVSDISRQLLNKIQHRNLVSRELIDDYYNLIHSFIQEEAILTKTFTCGYIHVPDQDADTLFKQVAELYEKRVVPKLVLENPKLAEQLISLREAVLSGETAIPNMDPMMIRKSIFSEEFAKLTHLSGDEGPYPDFFRLARVITEKSLESDLFIKGARERSVENGLKKVVLEGKGTLERYMSLSIGRDLPLDSDVAKSIQQDPSLLSYVYYGPEGPELFLCPWDRALVKSILRELALKYSFNNLTSLSFLLLLFKNKDKLLSLISDPGAEEDFKTLGYSCLAHTFPWYRRLAFFVGMNGGILSGIFRELGEISYRLMGEKLKYEEKIDTIKKKLRQELIVEVRELLDSILEK
ncbi:exonuclease [Leptospira langatensis]|uniref:Exonuclease n=1 Tax=Leptospira langatensis TaxID=2484983 RepID=A0A5F1ZT97_9LEPT|nr:exonuclease [Leptospira langatensis]TGK02728.1 exonuclease [Leptospira langatensis]TGL40068.1 exonuclease [Leptospira langatensis]